MLLVANLRHLLLPADDDTLSRVTDQGNRKDASLGELLTCLEQGVHLHSLFRKCTSAPAHCWLLVVVLLVME